MRWNKTFLGDRNMNKLYSYEDDAWEAEKRNTEDEWHKSE